MARNELHSPLGDLLGCEYPIMLAGMSAEATPPELVAAVSNAGGFGVSGMTGYTPEQMRADIKRIRELTDRPFGIDLLLPAKRADVADSREEARDLIRRNYPEHWRWVAQLREHYKLPDIKDPDPYVGVSTAFIERQVEVIVEEKVSLFAAALGDPSWAMPQLRKAGIKVVGLAGSVRNAMRHKEAGVDIIVAQGHEAGGHTGKIANFVLIPEIVDAIAPTPVVAAGGIADGRTLAAALSLGAIGVWVGTAFLFAKECAIPKQFLQGLIRGSTGDFVISKAFTGKTARGYKTPVKETWEQSGLEPLPMPLQQVLMDDFSASAFAADRLDLLHYGAGQVAGRLFDVKPAKQIVDEMLQGALDQLQSFYN